MPKQSEILNLAAEGMANSQNNHFFKKLHFWHQELIGLVEDP